VTLPGGVVHEPMNLEHLVPVAIELLRNWAKDQGRTALELAKEGVVLFYDRSTPMGKAITAGLSAPSAALVAPMLAALQQAKLPTTIGACWVQASEVPRLMVMDEEHIRAFCFPPKPLLRLVFAGDRRSFASGPLPGDFLPN
jgi:hypothetical protein